MKKLLVLLFNALCLINSISAMEYNRSLDVEIDEIGSVEITTKPHPIICWDIEVDMETREINVIPTLKKSEPNPQRCRKAKPTTTVDSSLTSGYNFNLFNQNEEINFGTYIRIPKNKTLQRSSNNEEIDEKSVDSTNKDI